MSEMMSGIDDLMPLTKTSPCSLDKTTDYDHIFIGHSYHHKAFPVALYDPILAELTYKLRNLDASDDVATKLFPDAGQFREASKTFCREGAGCCVSESQRRWIIFKWLKEIFGDRCNERYRCCEEEDFVVGGVEAKVGQLEVPTILIGVKHRFGDAVLQNVKVFAEKLLDLQVRPPLCHCDFN